MRKVYHNKDLFKRHFFTISVPLFRFSRPIAEAVRPLKKQRFRLSAALFCIGGVQRIQDTLMHQIPRPAPSSALHRASRHQKAGNPAGRRSHIPRHLPDRAEYGVPFAGTSDRISFLSSDGFALADKIKLRYFTIFHARPLPVMIKAFHLYRPPFAGDVPVFALLFRQGLSALRKVYHGLFHKSTVSPCIYGVFSVSCLFSAEKGAQKKTV